jgi:hypothetical protein
VETATPPPIRAGYDRWARVHAHDANRLAMLVVLRVSPW